MLRADAASNPARIRPGHAEVTGAHRLLLRLTELKAHADYVKLLLNVFTLRGQGDERRDHLEALGLALNADQIAAPPTWQVRAAKRLTLFLTDTFSGGHVPNPAGHRLAVGFGWWSIVS
jgi:hypothetical protein